MRLGTALMMAEAYGFMLRLRGLPMRSMRKPARTLCRNRCQPAIRCAQPILLAPQRVDQPTAHCPRIVPGTLSAGDKKDMVLTNRLWSHLDRVAIYGWHRSDVRHPDAQYRPWLALRDYSHGARLISTQVFVNGQSASISMCCRIRAWPAA